ncbi:MAG: hypothetical protein ABIG93_04325 [archaeon]|nr:hypothetical protein [Nanoarchaeota archaeon]
MLEYIAKKAADCRANIGDWYYEHGTEFSRALGLSLGVAALLGIASMSCKGYVGAAEEGLEPLREEFRTECTEDNYKSGKVLVDILNRRDAWLENNGYKCGCERWECQRMITGPDGLYRAVFNKKLTCGQKEEKSK